MFTFWPLFPTVSGKINSGKLRQPVHRMFKLLKNLVQVKVLGRIFTFVAMAKGQPFSSSGTLCKFNMEPENDDFQKESTFPVANSQVGF